jgi:FAD synthase
MPPFLRIPVYEECKLLPANGIYAVTAVSDQSGSKGMALIHQNPGQNPEVLVHFFENAGKYEGMETCVFFHKKIHGYVSLADTMTSDRLYAARAEISELIF